MYRRTRLFVAAVLACACCAAVAQPASAWVYTDVRWSLDTSWKTYGGGTNFHISTSGDTAAYYRWLDGDMTKTTVISGNTCGDFSQLGSATFTGGDTSYRRLFWGIVGQCFVLRGRTTAGSTIAHNGRLRR
jgi:hypothetical protein